MKAIIHYQTVIVLLFSSIHFFAQTFSASSQTFYNVGYSCVVVGDYNNDGYLDILLTGIDGSNGVHSTLYSNVGDGTFTEQNMGLTSVYLGSVDLGDYNNDGYLDILLSGYTGSTNTTKIYKNNGNNTFSDAGYSLQNLHVSSVKWGDYNNDGHLDFALTGWTGSTPYAKIYKNNGDNPVTFTAQNSISLTGVLSGTVIWGDYNNDGFLDLLICGSTVNAGNGTPATKIYKNNGDGTFTEILTTITGLTNSTGGRQAAWGDYDNDGDLDLVIAGSDNAGTRYTKIYRNDGNDTFTEQSSIALQGITHGSVAWGDYNNDGYLDIFLCGYTGSTTITKLYKNNGNNTFTDVTSGEPFANVWTSSSIWGDFNNDGKLDVLLSGQTPTSGTSGRTTVLYRNGTSIANTSPTAPTNLSAAYNGSDVTFSWTKSTDTQTSQNGLSYNLFIGTTANGVDIVSPMSNPSTGFRKIAAIGSIQSNSWTFKNLPTGNYYWGVQAIDAALSGSSFATVSNSPLPVELISFTGEVVGNSVLLNWQTATEVNNYGFEVQRKNEKSDWQKISFIQGHGNSNSTKIYSFTDKNLIGGKVMYRLKQIDFDGKYEYSNNIQIQMEVPEKYILGQNHPNPFNPTTRIKYEIPVEGNVKLIVYDILGREISVLVNEIRNAGSYEVEFNAEGIGSGVYFYSLNAKNYSQTKSMILLK